MKAAVIRRDADGAKVLVHEDVAEPTVGPGQVKVQVAYAGICGSDLHGFLDAAGTSRTDGLIMSHEAAGTVAAVGEGVTRLRVGDTVTVDPQVVCGQCVPCRNGWLSICDNKGVIGSSLRGFVQGAMAEFVVVDQNQAIAVPADLPLDQAAVLEPLANALHVVGRMPAGARSVVVLGAGPLGLCLVQSLRARGIETIIATDVAPGRLALAQRYGAAHAFNGVSDDVHAEVMELTDGQGADVVIESVGIDATYQQAIALVRKRGSVMFFGAVQPTVTLPLLPILHKELLLIGCTGANDETDEAVELVRRGAVELSSLITHQLPLSQAQEAMRVLSDPTSGAIKVQVIPGQSG